MARADLPALMAIAAVAHPHFPEAEAVFAERMALFPPGCRVLADADGRLHGYVFSHPWRADEPVPLDTLLAALPANPGALYLHDLALLPSARGTGAAGAVVRELVALAADRGLACVSLVAVSGSSGFWRQQGFGPREGVATEQLRGYGADAVFMACPLGASPPTALPASG